jgi:DNA-directed RNA polymerase specialized sigma24 family protein
MRRKDNGPATPGDAPPADEIEGYRAYLLRYAMHHLRDASLAEDAVQETLVAAQRRRQALHRFDQVAA